ncbi:MAG: CapA family protein [Bacteroidales bacterium]|nr:CapA family protein [Bacteroidales bacterium]
MTSITINFFGDLNLGHQIIKDPFKNIKKNLLGADLNVCNLEGPIIKDYKTGYIRKSASICTLDNHLKFLYNNNINCVCLANNHIMDYQKDGLEETILKSENNEIHYFGAGNNLEKSLTPAIYKVNNVKIGFIGFSWDVIQSINAKKNNAGTAPLYKKIILNTIKKNKQLFDFLVVSLHFNYEFEQWPLPSQRKMCHEIIDNGADIIIGHHPHIFQGVEIYKNKLIAYSMGNFFFSNIISKTGKELREWSKETKHSIMLKIKLLQDLSYKHEVVPICTDKDWQLYFLKNEERNKLLEQIEYLSLPFYKDDINYRSFWKKNRKRFLPDHFTDVFIIQKIAIIIYKIIEKISNRK